MNKEMKHIVKLSIICAISSFVLFCGSKKNDPSPESTNQNTNRAKINGKTWRNTSFSFFPPVTLSGGTLINTTKIFPYPADSIYTVYFDLDNSILTINTVSGMSPGSYYSTSIPVQLLNDDSTLVYFTYYPVQKFYLYDTLIINRVSDCKMSLYKKNLPYKAYLSSDTIKHIKYYDYVCN